MSTRPLALFPALFAFAALADDHGSAKTSSNGVARDSRNPEPAGAARSGRAVDSGAARTVIAGEGRSMNPAVKLAPTRIEGVTWTTGCRPYVGDIDSRIDEYRFENGKLIHSMAEFKGKGCTGNPYEARTDDPFDYVHDGDGKLRLPGYYSKIYPPEHVKRNYPDPDLHVSWKIENGKLRMKDGHGLFPDNLTVKE